MHVVILTQVLDRQDAVLGFFHGWTEHFARHVERLTVMAQRVGRVELPAHVQVVPLGKDEGGGRGTMMKRVTQHLVALRDADRPDAIWAHMVPKLVLCAAPVALPRGIPIYLWYTHASVDWSLRAAVPFVKKVFTASAESFRLPLREEKLLITGHGIDCSHFGVGRGPRPVDALVVGRIAPSKGQDEIIKALAHMQPIPRTEIVGDILLEKDEVYRDRLLALVRMNPQLGVKLSMRGAVPWPDIPALMRRARVLVDASHTGSIDKVVLEAMASGTVPLTCNEAFAPLFGELSDRLMYGRSQAGELAHKLTKLLSLSPEEHAALGEQVRGLVLAHHDLAALVPRLVAEMRRQEEP
jgi:glycosyltransferase involved in cell wall biosynthesis